MISFVFSIFFKKTFLQKTFFWKLIFESLSIFFTLAVIFYAGQAFTIKNNLENMPLFVFLLVGEIALIMPISFAERLLAHFLEIKHQQFYQTLIGLRISPTSFIFSKALVDAIFPFTRVLVILAFSALFLNFQFSFSSLLAFLLLQFFVVVIFALMALITTLLYLKFNRGIGFFYALQSFAAILGGVYFPTNVFPTYLKNFSSLLPQTQVLQASRLIFQALPVQPDIYSILFVWLLLTLVGWFMLERYLINWLKQNALFF